MPKKRRPAAQARAKSAARKMSKTKPAKQSQAPTSRDKVRAHRARMRKQGFRLVQMWLPDTRSKDFAEQAHKDSLAIARSVSEADDQAFIDSASWRNSAEAAAMEKLEP